MEVTPPGEAYFERAALTRSSWALSGLSRRIVNMVFHRLERSGVYSHQLRQWSWGLEGMNFQPHFHRVEVGISNEKDGSLNAIDFCRETKQFLSVTVKPVRRHTRFKGQWNNLWTPDDSLSGVQQTTRP